jgi:hypothetical protein
MSETSNAAMVESADAGDLKSPSHTESEGSSPSSGTILTEREIKKLHTMYKIWALYHENVRPRRHVVAFHLKYANLSDAKWEACKAFFIGLHYVKS